MSYNVDTLGIQSPVAKTSGIFSVINVADPQVIVAQGIGDSKGAEAIAAIANSRKFAKWTPFLGANRGMMIYDSTKVKLLNYTMIPTAHLPIDEWLMVVSLTSDTVIVASCHFVDGLDSLAQAERALQAQALRAHLHQRKNVNVVVVGTLNFTASDEVGFHWLVDDAPFGDTLFHNPLFDPVNVQGVWHHNDTPRVVKYHTYSTRLDSTHDTSGMVDRFDFILLTSNLLENSFVKSTYHAIGWTGGGFGMSITKNGQLTTSLYPNLENSSTHLPVTVDLVFRQKTSQIRMHRILPSGIDLTEAELNAVLRGSAQGVSESAKIPPISSTPKP
jgi:hypothetical protein